MAAWEEPYGPGKLMNRVGKKMQNDMGSETREWFTRIGISKKSGVLFASPQNGDNTILAHMHIPDSRRSSHPFLRFRAICDGLRVIW